MNKKHRHKSIVILASNSPRRRELFSYLGIPFRVVCPGHSEEINHARTFQEVRRVVRENALNKARTVSPMFRDHLVISADTVVFSQGRLFPKPRDEKEAKKFLWLLSRNPHYVYTGVAFVMGDREETIVEKTKVFMHPLTKREIEHYFSREKVLDKAGGFGIQGFAGAFIYRIEGCFYNVIGLPLARVRLLLKQFGIFAF